MDWNILVQVSGIGFVFLLNFLGGLALVLPGRLDAAAARTVGLGRHVEALLILSLAATVYRGGIGNVPVYIDANGVVAFSLIGAVLPTILSLHFLVRAGLTRSALTIVGIAAVAVVSYYVSAPAEDLGIVATYPSFLLPSFVAAFAGTLIAPLSLRAIPIAYACGSLGALIGGDLVRFDWVVKTHKPIAGSFGGAEVFDLVFLAGLWGAAFAFLPLMRYWSHLRRPNSTWEGISRMARDGRPAEAVALAVRTVEANLAPWAAARGMEGRPQWEIRALSFAEPVLGPAEDALRVGAYLDPELARRLLVQLEALHRRLGRPLVPLAAPVGRRAWAGAVDLLPPLVLAIAASLIPTSAPVAARAYFALTAFIAGHVLYPLVAEWAFDGRTIGKALFGLRVRRTGGGAPSGWDCLVRNLGRLLDLPLLYLIAVAAPDYTGRQRLGDYFAEVVVVTDTATRMADTTRPAPTPMPASHTTEPIHRAPR